MKDLIRVGLVEAMIKPVIGPVIGGSGGGGHPEPVAQQPMNFNHNEGAFAILIDGGDGNDYVDDSGDPIMERNSLEPTVYGSLSGNNRTSIGSVRYYYEFLVTKLPVGTAVGIGAAALDNRASNTDIRGDYWNGWYNDGVKINNPNYSSKGSQTTWAETFAEGDRIGIEIDQSLDDIVLYVNGVEKDRIVLTNTGTGNILTMRLIGDGVKLDHTGASYTPAGTSEW